MNGKYLSVYYTVQGVKKIPFTLLENQEKEIKRQTTAKFHKGQTQGIYEHF